MAVDHSKRGRRYVTLVDPESLQVTLLEPWEHAILVLCDGTRTAQDIVEMLPVDADDGPEIDAEVVHRCFKFFERSGLIHDEGLRASSELPPGPRTMAEIQTAYREWHKEPVRTGQFADWLSPSFPNLMPSLGPGLDPTVAYAAKDPTSAPAPVGIGSTLVLSEAESVLIDSSPGAQRHRGRGPRAGRASRWPVDVSQRSCARGRHRAHSVSATRDPGYAAHVGPAPRDLRGPAHHRDVRRRGHRVWPAGGRPRRHGSIG